MNAASVEAIHRRRRRYFENNSQKFHFEGPLIPGGHSDTYLIRETGGLGKRYVAKFSTSDARSLHSLRKEVRIARKLYGALHVSQPLVVSGAMLALDSVPKKAPQEDKVVLIMEFLPGLTLRGFIDKTTELGMVIPNRVLWMIFLCLARMVTAMGNPPNREFDPAGGNPATIETLPAREPASGDYQIFHGDMDNLDNMVFGHFDTGEHWFVPVLTSIDFGLAVDEIGANISGRMMRGVSPGTFTQANVYYAGRAMQRVCSYDGAIDQELAFSNLDMDLYSLATRCASPDHRNRPSLAELTDTIIGAIHTKRSPESFPGKPHASCETDENIWAYVQTVMLYSLPPRQLEEFAYAF
ncbi:hypothetical protein F4779DRAFT_573872 [Xylariaceae sp. FL0662B]|nr:hypothetical protein F4779DRAFT_573872 [Xylariaceae sp. FL0662B]